MGRTTMAPLVSLALAWLVNSAFALSPAVHAVASQSLEALMADTLIATRPAAATATPDLSAIKASVLAGNYTPKGNPKTARSCPQPCVADTKNWFVYHSLDRLAACNGTMLLDFALFQSISELGSPTSVAACVANLDTATSSSDKASCPQHNGVSQKDVTASLELRSSSASFASSSTAVNDAVDALTQLQAFSTLSGASCNDTINFAVSGTVAIGVYAGAKLTSQALVSSVLGQLTTYLQSQSRMPQELLVQLCDNYSARYSLGIYITTSSDLSSAQVAVQSWKRNTCVTSLDGEVDAKWLEISYQTPSLLGSNSTSLSNTSTILGTDSSTLASRSSSSSRVDGKLDARDTDCTTVQAVSGDSCASLAAECGITAAEFTEYNPSSTLCSSLVAGEHVCCSAGTLPDYSPSPYENGTCYTYLVQAGDSCSSLAAAYDITSDDIETWNEGTWGWYGCSDLLAGYTICLSSGYAPQPANVPNAVCGPQVNGTAILPGGTNFSTINECPLNACCDIWGECGTTADFCTISESGTGAPGTAAPGQNGCISNCGTEIVVSSAPASTYAIAYFEGFDLTRPCLKPTVNQVNTTAYTHIHLAFATLNADFSVNTSEISAQLPFLQAMDSVKRVVSFGGWAFCTDPDTYSIMRDAVSTTANLQTLVANIVDFVSEYDLDGIDWDWEYPDEPDIPGIPAGSPEDSVGYFLLLYLLKEALPAGKTLSFTAPASFWYLQSFDVLAMSAFVDYIVFMTYDLHGQWDYGSANSDPGCSGGNCLRSHVNLTETINALSMITKAGVPSSMVAVGVTSYGRAFEMTEAGCWTEMCEYVGPDSGAEPGICTGVAGYLADYEINLVASENPSVELLWDSASYSDIMVWNQTQWVAYMNATNKAVREALYDALGFLGTADWAVDLAVPGTDGLLGDSLSSSSLSSANETIYVNPDIWGSATPVVTALPGVTLIWPPMPLSSTTTITFDPWTTTVSYSSLTTTTTTATDGTISTVPWFVYVSYLTVLTIPPVTTTAIPVWGVTLPTGSDTEGTFALTSSVQPEPFTITLYPTIGGTTSIIDPSTTLTSSTTAAIVWGSITYSPAPETATLGESTSVIGGTILPPVTTVVTPNPHPTTVPTTTDPVVNPKTPKWTSGKPPAPTATPGCVGCGLSCTFFCDSGCPFCPPDLFGTDGGGGGGGDPDDGESSSSSESSTSEEYSGTIYYATALDDTMPVTYDAMSELSSISSAESTSWDVLFGTSTTTNTSFTTTARRL
ncbi:hypothetical protein N0V82_000864 [Gnomoniopsis sp. IMI 355080]|nr:hypothetical protein N0V82_000864 [Gnomoniopsis sp. IMI 355080]